MKWQRTNKQRNYKRNDDIIYNSVTGIKYDSEVTYDIVTDVNLYLDGQYLKLKTEELEYNYSFGTDRIRPFTFITMEVDNNMNLNANIPNVIKDSCKFEIDNNLGNLILTYG